MGLDITLDWQGPITLDSGSESLSNEKGVYAQKYPTDILMYYFGGTKNLKWRITEHFFLTMAGYYVIPKRSCKDFKDKLECHYYPEKDRDFTILSNKESVLTMWEHLRSTQYYFAEIKEDMDVVWGVERALITKSIEKSKNESSDQKYCMANMGFRGCKSCSLDLTIRNEGDPEMRKFLGDQMEHSPP